MVQHVQPGEALWSLDLLRLRLNVILAFQIMSYRDSGTKETQEHTKELN